MIFHFLSKEQDHIFGKISSFLITEERSYSKAVSFGRPFFHNIWETKIWFLCSNQGDESSMGVEDKNNRITSKTNKLETRHLKLHEKTLEIKEIELKLKEEQQTENQQQLKEDDTKNKKKTEISSQTNKPKEIKTLEKMTKGKIADMLKHVWNVKVVIDGITTNVQGQLRKKSSNCT